nr:hypothetical protein [Tanacetum cinerariifolium]
MSFRTERSRNGRIEGEKGTNEVEEEENEEVEEEASKDETKIQVDAELTRRSTADGAITAVDGDDSLAVIAAAADDGSN